ncbi:MAG TPA: glycosyltransferase family 4 protein [Thermoplasmata archaeon]|nr:glycosyltransferase family 4 protein [Thermoplasmata archaeon]
MNAPDLSPRAPATPVRALRIALLGVGAIPIPPPGYGAVEDYIANLARELRALGHDVTVENRVAPLRSTRAREVVAAGTLLGDLAGRRFDVLHAHSPLTAEFLRLGGRPYVFTSHSRYWRSDVQGLDRVRLARDVLAVRGAEAVVALAPRVVPLFRRLRGDQGGPVEYVPFGVDGDRFHPVPDEAREGVVGLGVLAPHKRFDILAAAARQARVPAAVLGPWGTPGERDRLLAINPALDLTGELSNDELPRRLARAKVFVHPSDMELASVATLQAMACGLPVVGSDLLEGIVTPGVDGWLVDHRMPFEERVAETATHIRRLMSDDALWTRCSLAARTAALERHSWPSVATRISDVYRRVAEGAHRRRPG